MTPLIDLWLAILASAVLVFLVSSVLHMLLPIHKGDYRKLPDETRILAALRTFHVPPGTYGFPLTDSMKDMGSPEMVAKYQQGPVGLLTVLPNQVPAMGKSLILWLLYNLLISVFVGYVASLGLQPASPGMLVFRFTSSAALLAYSVPHLHDAIWAAKSWVMTVKFIVDGVIYSAVTAGAFVLLWPK